MSRTVPLGVLPILTVTDVRPSRVLPTPVRRARGTCIRFEIHPKNCDTFVQGKLAGYVQLNMREFRKGTTTYLDSSDEQGVKILAK